MVTLGYTVLILCVLGVLAALLLYLVAQKFKVVEDPRIDIIEKMLPGANCGGCGQAGCRALAEAFVKKEDISKLYCPVAGAAVEEQTEFTVVLKEVGAEKIKVIKVIREITGLGLKEAKELVDGAPKNIKEGVDKATADDIVAKLKEVGATCEVK